MLGGLGSFPLSLGGGETYQQAYLEAIQASLGSLFSKEKISIVGAENIALAHRLAGVAHAADMLTAQSLPGLATDSLRLWAYRLGIPVRDNDTDAELRAACEAKYSAQGGNRLDQINDSLSKILGNAYVTFNRFYGSDLVTEPTITRWKGGTLGLASYDIGGAAGDPNPPQHASGAWYSVRSHVLVEVTQPSNMADDDFLFLVNVRLFELLDAMLPATATFDWALSPYVGFILDESKLDYHAL